ncbi:hypothetical protein Tco_0202070 [Tanacetum coccineum]
MVEGDKPPKDKGVAQCSNGGDIDQFDPLYLHSNDINGIPLIGFKLEGTENVTPPNGAWTEYTCPGAMLSVAVTTALDVVPWETDGESILREANFNGRILRLVGKEDVLPSRELNELAWFLNETAPQVEPPKEGHKPPQCISVVAQDVDQAR